MRTKTALAIAVATFAGGCASGSGGGGGGGGGDAEAYACLIAGPLCPFILAKPASQSTSAVTPPPAAFSTWSDLAPFNRTAAPAVTTSLGYVISGGRAVQVADAWFRHSEATVQYDSAGRPFEFSTDPIGWTLGNWTSLTLLGQPALDLTPVHQLHESTSPFADISHSMFAVVANPFALGWNYQSFGAWNQMSFPGDGAESVGAISFGTSTAGSAIPTTGMATFNGKLGGLYIAPDGKGGIAAANVNVGVDFSTRSVTFASTGTRLTRDLLAGTAAPNLDLSGTLTYSPGTNAFHGTLTNAAGTMSGNSQGKFYGPSAQELGGVFSMKAPTGVEAFTGAYGAKR